MPVRSTPNRYFVDAVRYGVRLDCVGVNDAAVDGGALSTVTSATAAFTSADTGKTYTLASTTGAATTGTLTFVNATTCTMSVAAAGAMTGARLIYGTDDTAAWQAALNAASAGQTVDAANPTTKNASQIGSWRSLCAGNLTVPVGVSLGHFGRGPFDPQTNPAMNTWGPTFVMVQNATAFVTLNHGSGLGDFIFYSANQKQPTATTPTTTYAAVVTMNASGTAGCRIGSPYMPNAYIGLDIQGGRHVIGSPQIGPLYIAVRIDHSADTVSIQRIHCSPYWRICEGQTYTPTASTFDAYALNNAYAFVVYRSDAFAVDQVFSYGLYGTVYAGDSADTGQSPRCGYGTIGMVEADFVAVGIEAKATNTPGIVIGSATIGANSSGVGTAGQAAIATAASGTVAPKLMVGTITHRGTWAVAAISNVAGTLIAPSTNPGIAAGEFATGNTKIATSETTTSTTFANLATAGPSVTVNVGSSGKVELVVRARAKNSAANDCYIGVDISGATTTAATTIWLHNGNGADVLGEFSAQTIVTGLAAGSTTFKMQYAVAAGTGTFSQRELTVKPVL